MGGVLQKVLQHLQMDCRIPDDPLLAHLVLPRLELGLYQADPFPSLLHQGPQRGQDEVEGDEGDVHGKEVQRIRDLFPGEITGIGPLHAHHLGVGAQAVVQLVIPHVHRIDLLCPVLEHTVGKSAGGGPDVGAHRAVEPDGPELHGLFQLQPAPAHIRKGLAPDLHVLALRHRSARLVHLLIVYEYLSGHDDRLGFLAALRQPALHHHHIQPLFILHGPAPPSPGGRAPLHPVPDFFSGSGPLRGAHIPSRS